MAEVEITVQGSHRTRIAPERAVVRVRVDHDGPDADATVAQTADAAAAVRASIEPLHGSDDMPVTSWSSGQVRTWAERPWNQDGAQLPLVHHARQPFVVEFGDVAALGRWVTDVVQIAGAAVDGIDWELTPDRRAAVIVDARAAAVADAVAKARSYADSLGLTTVTALEVADAGMLRDSPGGGGGPAPVAMRAARMEAHGGGLEFEPHDIEITVDVDARFIAG